MTPMLAPILVSGLFSIPIPQTGAGFCTIYELHNYVCKLCSQTRISPQCINVWPVECAQVHLWNLSTSEKRCPSVCLSRLGWKHIIPHFSRQRLASHTNFIFNTKQVSHREVQCFSLRPQQTFKQYQLLFCSFL